MAVESTSVTHNMPAHIAIIMDGNGRWAKERGLDRSEGHRAGTLAARDVVLECLALGIPHLSLYAFSRENWHRPAQEVRFLFNLMVDFITLEMANFKERGVRLNVFGEAAALPFAARRALQAACKRTSGGTALNLNLALNYSGRDELARACRQIVEKGIAPEDITPETIAEHLYSKGQPDPDLIIRTSGELRLSNFLLFQSAYSELYFTDVYWPDFKPANLREAVERYGARKRRFGRVDAPAEPGGAVPAPAGSGS